MNSIRLILFLILPFLFSKDSIGQNIELSKEFEKAYQLCKEKKYKQAINLFKNINEEDDIELANSLIIKGFVFKDSISGKVAKKYFEQADALLQNTNYSKLKCKSNYGQGKLYYDEADFTTAIKFYLKMNYEAEKNGLIIDQQTACGFLGDCYLRLNRIVASSSFTRKAIALAKLTNDSVSVISYYNKIANNYLWYTTNDPATFVYGDSILIALKDAERYTNINDPMRMAALHNAYSNAFYAKNDLLKMNSHIREAYKYCIKTNDTSKIIIVLENLANSYFELKSYDSALVQQKKIDWLNERIKGVQSKDHRISYNFYYRIYKALNNQKLALEYLEKWVRQDEEFNENKNIDIQQLKEKFEVEKTNLFIKTEAEKTRVLYIQKRNIYLVVFGAAFIVLIFISLFIYYRLKVKKEKEKKTLELLVQNAELTALKAQMNPHFIFNALNSIQHSIVTNNTEDAYRFLAKFSKLIRNILDNSSQQLIPLKTEIETLSLYVDVESKRFDNSFHHTIEIHDNGFSGDSMMIPPMMLQPFIENAIWHGLMPKMGDKNLLILFTIYSLDYVICEITDNGIGREKAKQIAAEKNKKHKSKGIANVYDRVKLLEKTHSFKITIDIVDCVISDNLPNGTEIVVKFKK